jgi:ABC-type branched-subunit amino acid transport system ATPase component/ABC-type branched-subunit amino acid transport system permease subunit
MSQTRWAIVCWFAFVAIAFLLPQIGVSSRWLQLLALIGINTLLAQSMNLIGGYTGQISLGQAGVYAAGAYGSAVLSTKLHCPVWLSLPAGVLLATAVGFLVAYPAKRVREFYLGMVTLGFGIVAFEVLQYWTPVTGGFMGLSNIPSPTLRNLVLFGVPVSMQTYLALTLSLVVLFSWMKANLVRSYIGRSFVAAEGSDMVASSLGIRPDRTKHQAYVISSAWAGLAGGIYAHLTAFVSPDSFNLWTSVTILVMAVFGGLRTLVGPVLGATFFTLLPEFTQGFERFQYLAYGVILMLSYILLPRGIAGLIGARPCYIDPRLDGLARPEAPPSSSVRPHQTDALRVKDLAMQFGGVQALKGVDMSVRAGTIHGLIGPNGSGKSTMVNIITGVYQPTGGEIFYRGKPIHHLTMPGVAAMGIGRTFQNPQGHGDMSVRESVLTGAHMQFRSNVWECLLRTPAAAAEELALLAASDRLIEDADLTDCRNDLVKNLPYGRKRLAEIVRSLNARPDLLILDEPAAGLSEVELGHLAHLLGELRSQGLTIVLIEHHLDFLFRLIDDVTVLDSGNVIFHGPAAESRRDKNVIESYLGSYVAP